MKLTLYMLFECYGGTGLIGDFRGNHYNFKSKSRIINGTALTIRSPIEIHDRLWQDGNADILLNQAQN